MVAVSYTHLDVYKRQDTQSAMNYAIRTGAKKIVIFGVTGNRVDHLMANFGLLVLAQKQGAEVTLVDQYNYMKLVSDGEIIKKSEQFGKYISCILYTSQRGYFVSV